MALKIIKGIKIPKMKAASKFKVIVPKSSSMIKSKGHTYKPTTFKVKKSK